MSDAPPTHILLAEDSADDVLLLKRAFRKAGATSVVHNVSDGLEALAYLHGEPPYHDRDQHPFPHLLLLDLNMPRMNGIEVLRHLRSDPRPAFNRLPVFVFSASNLPTDIERVYDLHAHAYIVKPNRVDELVAFASALNQWLRFTTWPHPSRPPAS